MSGRRTRWTGVVAVAATVLAMAACGNDDSNSATTTTGTPASTTAVEADSSGTTTTAAVVPRPTSMQDWEALWARQRDAIVKRAEDDGWGKSPDGKTLTGPDGLSVDLSQCPAGWSDTEGLTDTTIKLGHTMGLSGIYANPTTAAGIATMLDHYSKNGAFKDANGKTRSVEYIVKDDAVDPTRTPALTDELIDSVKVFADMTSASANTFQVYDKLNERCIPHPVILTGHPAWGDPVNHPWTTGYVLAYTTESIMWGAFIDQHLAEFPDGKVTIATLALNNDYGKVATDALKAYLADSPNKDRYELVSETIELATPVITDPMTTLASEDPDFLFVMVGGGQCAAVINEAAQNGMHDNVKYLFLPNICLPVGPTSKAAVSGDGMAADGWWVVNGGGIDTKDTSMQDDAFVVFAKEQLAARGHSLEGNVDYNTGLGAGWIISQVLQIASQLPGGLTRSNVLLAQRSLELTSPMLLEGMKLNTSGTKDPYPLESAVIQKWNATDQVWVNQGDPIDLSGVSKPCAWDAAAQLCR